jgi:hypothetical protein
MGRGYDSWVRAGKRKERKRKQNQFKIEIDTSNYSNLIQFKQDLPELRKFEIKYGWKVFEIKNNFPYKDFLRFEINFELKFREASMSWKQGKNDWNFLGTRILTNLANGFLFAPY